MEIKKINKKPETADAERCICCGAIIPEGQQFCYFCMMEAEQRGGSKD